MRHRENAGLLAPRRAATPIWVGVLFAILLAIVIASASSTTAPRTPSTRVLLGNQDVANYLDSTAGGSAAAFQYTAARDGRARGIELHVDAGTTATKLFLGLYADADGKPGSLVTSGSLSPPKPGAWNAVPVRSTLIKSGARYWIAMLSAGGALNYPDTSGGTARSYFDTRTGLTSLPSQYSPGTSYPLSPASAFVTGIARGGPMAPRGTSSPVGAGGRATGGGAASVVVARGGGNCVGVAGSHRVDQAALDRCGSPSTNTTGPSAGARLINSGGFTASTPGAVYSGLNVRGAIHISANNVTIENSNITDVDPNNAAIQVARGVTGTQINYTSIHGTNTGQSGALAFGVANYGSTLNSLTMNHDSFYNGDRILTGYGTVTNSYCLGGSNFSSSGGLEHDECIYTDGSAPGIRAIHDTLLNPNSQTAAVFVDGPQSGGGGVDGTVDIEDSILAGGDYCLYGGGENPAHTGPETIIGNRFSRLYSAACGQFGTHAHFPSSGVTWSGNVWDDTSQSVPLS